LEKNKNTGCKRHARVKVPYLAWAAGNCSAC
jgi:hypothetical protein